jgi:membrane protein DedA with SNARE-associated domain
VVGSGRQCCRRPGVGPRGLARLGDATLARGERAASAEGNPARTKANCASSATPRALSVCSPAKKKLRTDRAPSAPVRRTLYDDRSVAAASITNSLVQFATNVVGDLGLLGIFVLMLAESACIPIPSEATMLFAGFSVSQGRFSLLAITIAGVAGNLVGSWIAYAVGYYGRLELVQRHAGKLHIKSEHLEWADRWFARYGDATVFFTRLLPIIRTFISLPAGVARMPLARFTVFTLLGCIPWVFLLGFIGDQVGHNWKQWKDSLSYVDYVMAAAIVGGIVYLVVRRVLARGRPPSGLVSSSSDNERHTSAPPVSHLQREARGDVTRVPGEHK